MHHVFVSGDPGLDLAGTLRWRRSRPQELLGSVTDLQDWLVQADVVDGVPIPTAEDCARALSLREAVYAAASARLAGTSIPLEVVDHLNSSSGGPQVAYAIVGGRLRRTGDIAAVLATVARGAMIAVGGPDGDLLRECDRPDCTRVFLDRSRGARRRWCGMAECGSQQKMVAYRTRLRGGPDNVAAAIRPDRAATAAQELS